MIGCDIDKNQYARKGPSVPRRPVNILFLCTGNSAGSIIAEAILSRDGNGRFRAFSAGIQPRGEIHPLTLELLASLGIPTRDLRCKGLHEFAGAEAPVMDAVISVCDEPAIDAFPALPGSPVTARWGIPDPARIHWDDTASRAAFLDAYLSLHGRIARLVALPFETLDRDALRDRLEEIGRTA
jgi:protein-tyrosine-phosphatase